MPTLVVVAVVLVELVVFVIWWRYWPRAEMEERIAMVIVPFGIIPMTLGFLLFGVAPHWDGP